MWDPKLELEDFLKTFEADNVGFIQPEEFLKIRPKMPEETIKTPEEFLVHEIESTTTKRLKQGDITRLLQTVPGILPPVDSFSRSYIPPRPVQQPDMILNDKIPILLHEKYFKFKEPANIIGTAADVDNNSDSNCCESNNGSSNGQKTPDIQRQFWTVFSDSDFDNCNDEMMETQQRDFKVGTEISSEAKTKYFTPYELYMKKRGNKDLI